MEHGRLRGFYYKAHQSHQSDKEESGVKNPKCVQMSYENCPLLKRLLWSVWKAWPGGHGHSLPHPSSQCQEQSKQNKFRGDRVGAGYKMQGAQIEPF